MHTIINNNTFLHRAHIQIIYIIFLCITAQPGDCHLLLLLLILITKKTITRVCKATFWNGSTVDTFLITTIITNKQIRTLVLIVLTWIPIQGTHYVMLKSNLLEWLTTALLFFPKTNDNHYEVHALTSQNKHISKLDHLASPVDEQRTYHVLHA